MKPIAALLEKGCHLAIRFDPFCNDFKAQPEAFGSIPQAMWWGLATLTTVGYGDVTPISVAGKLFGGLIMVLGIGMFALPAGILATAFGTEIRKREFVVTWNMVASVPLFSQLNALRISEIVALLEMKVMPPRSTIVAKGDKADAMYFISVGEALVDVEPEPQPLKAGEFLARSRCSRKPTARPPSPPSPNASSWSSIPALSTASLPATRRCGIS